jgi:hypothetical protein
MIAPVATIWGYSLDANQTRNLFKGRGASSMDEKWLIVADISNETFSRIVRFYRSWTGRQQFAVELKLTGTGSLICRAWWESDPTHLKEPREDFHRETFEGICEHLLRIGRPIALDS